MQQIKFLVGSILLAPVLPILMVQGNRIKRIFPSLPEAKVPLGKSGEGKAFQLVCLGESSMAGVGIDAHENGFAGNFSRCLAALIKKQINWRVYAKSGLTAELVRKQLMPQIKEQHADLVLVALGGNDTFQLNSPEKWARQIELLIQDIRKKYPKAPILFATMPPVHTFPAFTGPIQLVLGQLVALHGERLNRLIRKHNNIYFDSQKIDLNDWLRKYPGCSKEELYSDGVHPSSLTYQIWGKELAHFIHKQHYQD